MSKHYNDIPLPGMVPQTVGYSAPTIAKVAEITYRQLDHWTRKGLIQASIQGADGSGSKRLYSYRDLLRINIIRRLLRVGITLAKIETALEVADRVGIENFRIMGTPDGKVVAIDDDDNLMDLLQNGQGMFFLGSQDVVETTNQQLAKLIHLGTSTAGKPVTVNEIKYEDYDDFRRDFG